MAKLSIDPLLIRRKINKMSKKSGDDKDKQPLFEIIFENNVENHGKHRRHSTQSHGKTNRLIYNSTVHQRLRRKKGKPKTDRCKKCKVFGKIEYFMYYLLL